MFKFLPQRHPRTMSPAQLRGHLKFMHGTWCTGIETLADLHRCHGIRHNDPDPPYDLEHTHEPLAGH